MLTVFHVSFRMVYYSTRDVTLYGVSSGKANFGFVPNAVVILGCTHYVMSVYDVQRDCFKMISRNHVRFVLKYVEGYLVSSFFMSFNRSLSNSQALALN